MKNALACLALVGLAACSTTVETQSAPAQTVSLDFSAQ
jgi:hypothetical protein